MVTVEKLEKSRVKLTIEVNGEAFGEALQKAYLKTRGKYKVPGFRPGKAPKKMIESMYGESAFYEDAFDIIYPDAYESALGEHSIKPISSPDISIEKIGAGEPLVFTAEVDVQPDVLLGAFTGIEVSKRAYTVEDAQVDALIDQERERLVRYIDVERPVQTGDQVTLDYSGSVDGVTFEGGTAQNQLLSIGSGSFIPGFEEQLVGMKAGEERDITVTFPADYHAQELAGKAAIFHVNITIVQEKELPELDDEFAKDVSEFDTMEALRADKRRQLTERNELRAKNEMEDEALRKAVENASIDVPVSMIERQMDYMLREMQYRMSMSGLTLEQYCQYTGSTPAQLREGYRKEAQMHVRTQLVLEAIAAQEKMEVAQEDLDKEISGYAERNSQDSEAFKSTLQDEDVAYFKERVQVDKVIKMIMDNAVYTDAPAEKAEEKPAKKPAAKKAAPKKAQAVEATETVEAADAAEKPVKKPAAKKAAPKKTDAKDADAKKD